MWVGVVHVWQSNREKEAQKCSHKSKSTICNKMQWDRIHSGCNLFYGAIFQNAIATLTVLCICTYIFLWLSGKILGCGTFLRICSASIWISNAKWWDKNYTTIAFIFPSTCTHTHKTFICCKFLLTLALAVHSTDVLQRSLLYVAYKLHLNTSKTVYFGYNKHKYLPR